MVDPSLNPHTTADGLQQQACVGALPTQQQACVGALPPELFLIPSYYSDVDSVSTLCMFTPSEGGDNTMPGLFKGTLGSAHVFSLQCLAQGVLSEG